MTGHIVYFSSVTENTKRFVDHLGYSTTRIPIHPHVDQPVKVKQPYVLVVPTYGGGNPRGAVPKQVIKFLNDPENRGWCRGVISSGNTNFGTGYCLAGEIISRKVGVPHMYKFELLGTSEDVRKVKEGLAKFWQRT